MAKKSDCSKYIAEAFEKNKIEFTKLFEEQFEEERKLSLRIAELEKKLVEFKERKEQMKIKNK